MQGNATATTTTITANAAQPGRHPRAFLSRARPRDFLWLSTGRTYRALSVARIYNVSRRTLGVAGAKRSRGRRYNSFVWAAAKVVRLRRPPSVYAEKRISPGRRAEPSRCQTHRVAGLRSLTHVRGRPFAAIITGDRHSKIIENPMHRPRSIFRRDVDSYK